MASNRTSGMAYKPINHKIATRTPKTTLTPFLSDLSQQIKNINAKRKATFANIKRLLQEMIDENEQKAAFKIQTTFREFLSKRVVHHSTDANQPSNDNHNPHPLLLTMSDATDNRVLKVDPHCFIHDDQNRTNEFLAGDKGRAWDLEFMSNMDEAVIVVSLSKLYGHFKLFSEDDFIPCTASKVNQPKVALQQMQYASFFLPQNVQHEAR